MSQSTENDLLRPDDALPPVEPPSVGFIVQLFLIPGMIVTVIVIIWMLLTWLTQQGGNPNQFIEGLQSSGPNRWQMASNLANALRDERYVDFKRDPKSAARLAEILKQEIDQGRMEQNPVTLRVFLCRALGEFQVGNGVDVLLEAATTDRDPVEMDVRRSAIDALALLSIHMPQNNPPQKLEHPKLEPTLFKLSEDPQELIRSSAAFALGVLGTDSMLARLEQMLGDLHPDVRYNAATGLARHGKEQAIPVLQEMLDPEEQVGVELEKQKNMQETKRALLIVNGLQAARLIAKKNPTADLSPLIESIRTLTTADIHPRIKKDAEETLQKLQQAQAAAQSK